MDEEKSKTIRAGNRTYFVDLKTADDSKPYLRITESLFKGSEKDRERVSIIVFEEALQEFAQAVSDIVSEAS